MTLVALVSGTEVNVINKCKEQSVSTRLQRQMALVAVATVMVDTELLKAVLTNRSSVA
jgi:hypothetical protein